VGQDIYFELAERFDWHAMRVPRAGDSVSTAFVDYLKLLYSPEEARLVRHLRFTGQILPQSIDTQDFMSAGEVAALEGMDIRKAKEILDACARKNTIVAFGAGVTRPSVIFSQDMLKSFFGSSGLLHGMKNLGRTLKKVWPDIRSHGPGVAGLYAMPYVPQIINVHQFYPETSPDDLKAIKLYQEFFIKGGFSKYYEGSEKGTPVFRVIPVEKTIKAGQRILSTEEAHAIIDAAPNAVLVPCPCRTRTEKMGVRECRDRNPVGSCIMMGFTGLHFLNLGMGKKVTKKQAIDYLDGMQEFGLVAQTDNYSTPQHCIICLCCECCCSQVRGRTRWDNPLSMLPSNFVPEPGEDCVLCGKCVKRCFFGALTLDKKNKKIIVAPEKCVGCGVCTLTCKTGTLKLHRVERSTPARTSSELYQTIFRENRD